MNWLFQKVIFRVAHFKAEVLVGFINGVTNEANRPFPDLYRYVPN